MKFIVRPFASIAFTISLLAVLPVSGTVNLELSGGVTLHSTGDVNVQIDGNILMTGGSYFTGGISSGPRISITDFSSMHLNPGIDGTITCTTGSVYGKGHGEGTNFKRWYTITNTGSGPVTVKMKIDYTGSGANDERNSLAEPFFIYRYASSWIGYGFGVSASPDTADGVEIPTGSSDWVISEGSRVAMKVFMEGPYSTGTDLMETGILASIPKTSPYNEDARRVASIPAGVTDWVLLQARSTADGTIQASRSCFLKANGKLVLDDGATEYAGIKASPGDYFLVLKHRNHLKVMSATAVPGLTWGVTPASVYDFTGGESRFFGSNGAKQIETGVWGMWAGDVNQDKNVTTMDYTAWYNSARLGDSGYKTTDMNLDGVVTTSDYTLWYNDARLGASSTVP